VPKIEGFGGLSQCKELVDVLANAERVIGGLKQYDLSEHEGLVLHAGAGALGSTHGSIVAGGPDPLSGLSFLLAICAAAVARKAPKVGGSRRSGSFGFVG
jgi:hypothetical protein